VCDDRGRRGARGTFECEVDADGNTAAFLITQKDDNGNVRWGVKQ
jgi:hypothetical protein